MTCNTSIHLPMPLFDLFDETNHLKWTCQMTTKMSEQICMLFPCTSALLFTQQNPKNSCYWCAGSKVASVSLVSGPHCSLSLRRLICHPGWGPNLHCSAGLPEPCHQSNIVWCPGAGCSSLVPLSCAAGAVLLKL